MKSCHFPLSSVVYTLPWLCQRLTSLTTLFMWMRLSWISCRPLLLLCNPDQSLMITLRWWDKRCFTHSTVTIGERYLDIQPANMHLPINSYCCFLIHSQSAVGLKSAIEMVKEVLSSSYNTPIKPAVEALLAHFFSPYRPSYHRQDVLWFLECANKQKQWFDTSSVKPEEEVNKLMSSLTWAIISWTVLCMTAVSNRYGNIEVLLRSYPCQLHILCTCGFWSSSHVLSAVPQPGGWGANAGWRPGTSKSLYTTLLSEGILSQNH